MHNVSFDLKNTFFQIDKVDLTMDDPCHKWNPIYLTLRKRNGWYNLMQLMHCCCHHPLLNHGIRIRSNRRLQLFYGSDFHLVSYHSVSHDTLQCLDSAVQRRSSEQNQLVNDISHAAVQRGGELLIRVCRSVLVLVSVELQTAPDEFMMMVIKPTSD